MPLELFHNLDDGELFHFYDNPDRDLIKTGDNHYIAPEGRHLINTEVAIVRYDPPQQFEHSIYNREERR